MQETTVRITFVRHGETDFNKQHICQGQVDEPLSTVGMEQAKQLGEFVARSPEYIPKPGLVITSPLLRAKQTAAALHDLSGWKDQNVPFIESGLCQEYCFGPLEGCRYETAINLALNHHDVRECIGITTAEEYYKNTMPNWHKLATFLQTRPERHSIFDWDGRKCAPSGGTIEHHQNVIDRAFQLVNQIGKAAFDDEIDHVVVVSHGLFGRIFFSVLLFPEMTAEKYIFSTELNNTSVSSFRIRFIKNEDRVSFIPGQLTGANNTVHLFT